jgi:hypothetical protein
MCHGKATRQDARGFDFEGPQPPHSERLSSMTYHLQVQLENRIAFRALGLFQKYFPVESDPQMSIYIAHNLMHYSG